MEKVWQELEPWQPRPQLRTSWAEELKLGGKEGLIGQIDGPDDWHRLPPGQAVRIVAIKSEGKMTIRWAAHDADKKSKRDTTHDHLVSLDERASLRLVVDASGSDPHVVSALHAFTIHAWPIDEALHIASTSLPPSKRHPAMWTGVYCRICHIYQL
jgi:hypothetical protein